LNKEFQVRPSVGLAADFSKKKRIDVTAGGDKVQVGTAAGLCGMDVTQVARPVYDPEFFVAGREIENLFVIREYDERGETQFRFYRDDLFARVGHYTCAFTGGRRYSRR